MTNIQTAKGKRKINTPAEAKKIIESTAYANQYSLEELKSIEGVVKIAEHFKLDLDTLKEYRNPKPEEIAQGYATIYKFPAEVELL